MTWEIKKKNLDLLMAANLSRCYYIVPFCEANSGEEEYRTSAEVINK